MKSTVDHSDRVVQPTVLPLLPHAIPHELRQIPAWIGWRLELRDGRWNKVPLNARTGRPARIDQSRCWATFEDAVAQWNARAYDGIGLCRTGDLVFVDLDGCRDPRTGALADWPWVREILEVTRGRAYLEASPSGGGIHAVVGGRLPPGRRQWDDPAAAHVGFALYDRTRYLAVTGHALPETGPVVDLTPELAKLHNFLFGRTLHDAVTTKPAKTYGSGPANGFNREEFARLIAGDWIGYYASQSEADFALCCLLADSTECHPERIDAFFRASGLMREKWEREDYRTRTIQRAIDRTRANSGPATLRVAESNPASAPVVDGEPYCPYGLFATVQIPEAVAFDEHLSGAQKFVYSRKAFYAIDKDRTVVSDKKVAADLCVREDVVRSAVAKLDAAGWIRREPGNTVVFLWRPELRRCVRRENVLLIVGSPYRPRKLLFCVHVPMVVASCARLSWTAKLVFGLLIKHAGPRSPRTSVDREILASDLQISARTIDRALNKLTGEGLIRRTRDGDGRPAKTTFLWREWLRQSLLSTVGAAMPPLQRSDATRATSEPTQEFAQNGQSVVSELTVEGAQYKVQENTYIINGGESSSRSRRSDSGVRDNQQTSGYRTTVNRELRLKLLTALEDFEREEGLELRGPIGINEIVRLWQEIQRDSGDIHEFLATYRSRWTAPPTTWAHLVKSMRNWCKEPERRNRIDARRNSPALELLRNTAVALAEAVEMIDSRRLESDRPDEFSRAQVSPTLWVALEEEGVQQISPRDLLARQREYKAHPPCRQCNGEGVIDIPGGEDAVMSRIDWCDCVCGGRRRRVEPEFVDRHNQLAEKLGHS